MYTRKIPELSLFIKEKGLISNAKDSMVLLVKKNIQCCGSRNRKRLLGRIPMDIANMVLFLCSEKAGFITGENICIDGGMTKQMIYHGDCGWRFDI